MYFPDLSTYSYGKDEEDRYAINIGWLDEEHGYVKGRLTDDFLAKLWGYCKVPVRLTMGYHKCPFCHEDSGVIVVRDDENLMLGSAEIRVIGKDMVSFAAPDMIYHYIVDHEYLPPNEFVLAVLESPFPPESEQYQKRFAHL